MHVGVFLSAARDNASRNVEKSKRLVVDELQPYKSRRADLPCCPAFRSTCTHLSATNGLSYNLIYKYCDAAAA